MSVFSHGGDRGSKPLGTARVTDLKEAFSVESGGLHSLISKGTFSPLEMNKFV